MFQNRIYRGFTVTATHIRKLKQNWGALHTTSKRNSSDNTVNRDEVAKFSRLAQSWWDESGEFGALHTLNELRVPLVREALLSRRAREKGVALKKEVSPLKNTKVLDIGCGGGILSEALARLGADVTGVDASEENINVARLHADRDPAVSQGLSYVCSAVEDLPPEQHGSYDGVIASEIIEHVNNQEAFVASCCKLVKPMGSLFFTTMNKTTLSYALGIFAAEKVLKIVPDGAHDWQKFISPEDLETIVQKNGFAVEFVHGMALNPVTLKWSWTSRTDINYALHAIKRDPSEVRTGPTDSDSESSDSDTN